MRALAWLLLLGAAGLLLLAAAPLAPGLPAAAVEAGRPHLFVLGLGVLGGWMLLRRARRGVVVAGAVLTLAATVVHGSALRRVQAAPAADASPNAWRLVHANLGEEPDLAVLARWVTTLPAGDRPDGFSFQELKPGQPAALDAALPGYAAAWSLPRPDSRGGGLWLRAGVTAQSLRVRGVPSEAGAAARGGWLPPEAPASRPLAECTLVGADRTPLRLVLFSAARPSNAARYATRDAELDRLAALPTSEHPTAWLGDFNAPPWSSVLRGAAATAGMTLAADSRRTWPDGPLLGLGIPIDLCLVSVGTAATAEAILSIGSDHRPILATIRPRARADAALLRPPAAAAPTPAPR